MPYCRILGACFLGLLASIAEADSTEDWSRPARNTVWEVLFEDNVSPKEYATRLDYFGIELAVEASDGRIQYAVGLSQPQPQRRVGKQEDEHRVTIPWKSGSLPSTDRKILQRAGIPTQGKELRHYYPRKVELQLFELEKKYDNREPREIARTRFQIRAKKSAGSGYEFIVVEQEYHQRSPGDKSPEPKTEPKAEP